MLLKRFVDIVKQYKQLLNNKSLQLSNCNNKLRFKINETQNIKVLYYKSISLIRFFCLIYLEYLVFNYSNFFEQYLVCLVVKTVEHTKSIYIYILYYEVFETSYTSLVLDRIVILFSLLKCFCLESNFFFSKAIFSSIMSKLASSFLCCYSTIAKRKQLNRCITINIYNFYFS